MDEVSILKAQIQELSRRLEFLEKTVQHSQKQLIKDTVKEVMKEKTGDKLKAEVIRKFNRNKKDIMKQKIIMTARSRKMTLPELKEIVVDQLGYCSKASFYRYIDELKDILRIENGHIMVEEIVVLSHQ